jgi:POT family proton-dependent oligopeptide transporter
MVTIFQPIIYNDINTIFVYLWGKLGDKEPSTPKKFFYGLLITGIGYIVLSLPQFIFGISSNINALWLISTIFLIAVGEALISPIGTSISYALYPNVYKGRMMFLIGLTNASAQALNSQIVKFFNVNNPEYFIILGILPIIVAIFLFSQINKIEKVIKS